MKRNHILKTGAILALSTGLWSSASTALAQETRSMTGEVVDLGLSFLKSVAEVSFYVALVAWGTTFAGLVHHLARCLLRTGWFVVRRARMG